METATAWQNEWVISSESTDAALAVQQDILSRIEGFHYSARVLFGLKLSMEEAFVNAIKHGNKFNPNGHVNIYAMADEQGIVISVQDEGEGFNPDDVPDPTEGDNLEKASGRGLMLMRSFMNKVIYNDKGNQVTFQVSAQGKTETKAA